MPGPFVHNIDPIIFSVAGIHIWWYGRSFTLGFLNAHLFIRRSRERIGLSLPAVYDLTFFLAIGVLIGGRALNRRRAIGQASPLVYTFKNPGIRLQ